MQKDFGQIITDQMRNGGTFVLITVVDVSGSTPQQIGAKMLVSPDGERLWGTVGGGRIEKIALNEAIDRIKANTPLLKEYELLEEGEKATGMLCGGKMSLFYDILGASAKAYIFGAGHISQSLVPLLGSLGFWTVVIDDRREYLQESFKDVNVAETLTGDFPQIIDTIELERDSYVVILTY
ncbi:MAG: XdhC family protein, partial [Candidatus Heimdallarchaeota archaeon]